MKEKLVPTTEGVPGRADVFLDDLQAIHAILSRYGRVGIETERYEAEGYVTAVPAFRFLCTLT